MNEENIKFGWRDFAKAMWYLVKRERKKLLFFYAILFILHFWQLVPALVVGRIIDFFAHYQPGQSLDEFYATVIFLGGANGIVAFSRLAFKNQINQIMIQLTYLARVEGFEKLIDFSLRWHDQENSGNKVQRIQTGVATLRELARVVQNEVFELIALIAGITVVFFLLDPIFVVILVVYIVGFIAIQRYFNGRFTELNRKRQKAIEDASGRYYEGLGNVLTIKTMGAQKSFKKNIVDTEEVTKFYTKKMSTLGIRKWQVFQILNSTMYAVYLLLIGRGVATGQTSVGDILVLFNYVTRVTGVLTNSLDVIDTLIDNKVAVGRMMPIFQVETSNFGTKHFPRVWNSISIKNGFFAYKEHDNSLKNVNLDIKKGEKIGVVGKSGSGKSTLAKILMGLYPLDRGEFRVEGLNYYSISHEHITKHMALVLQESEMFNVSFRENITLMRNVPRHTYEKAIKIAQLEELIERLPEKENTLIGEKGYRLSGGERQRIGLARVICKNPDVLILDEATSALDSKTESLIQAAIEKELKEKTIISIAHRVSTLKNSDRILVFEKGEIVEEGNFKELVAKKKSRFNEIAKSQLKKV